MKKATVSLSMGDISRSKEIIANGKYDNYTEEELLMLVYNRMKADNFSIKIDDCMRYRQDQKIPTLNDLKKYLVPGVSMKIDDVVFYDHGSYDVENEISIMCIGSIYTTNLSETFDFIIKMDDNEAYKTLMSRVALWEWYSKELSKSDDRQFTVRSVTPGNELNDILSIIPSEFKEVFDMKAEISKVNYGIISKITLIVKHKTISLLDNMIEESDKKLEFYMIYDSDFYDGTEEPYQGMTDAELINEVGQNLFRTRLPNSTSNAFCETFEELSIIDKAAIEAKYTLPGLKIEHHSFYVRSYNNDVPSATHYLKIMTKTLNPAYDRYYTEVRNDSIVAAKNIIKKYHDTLQSKLIDGELDNGTNPYNIDGFKDSILNLIPEINPEEVDMVVEYYYNGLPEPGKKDMYTAKFTEKLTGYNLMEEVLFTIK